METRPALLGAQDRQCLEQAAQEPAIEGQACAPGDLDGRDQEGCTRRVPRKARVAAILVGAKTRIAAGRLGIARVEIGTSNALQYKA
jgi:hypothetical protein